MSQPAIDAFSITRRAIDPRADGGTRVVHVSATRISIDRVLEKVRMRVAVPVAAYQDLVLSVRLQAGTATLRLRHEDPDLDVALATGEAIEVTQKAKGWGVVFGKTVVVEEVCVPILPPFARQRQRVKATRRSSFAKRRKIGIADRQAISFAGEDEIIART